MPHPSRPPLLASTRLAAAFLAGWAVLLIGGAGAWAGPSFASAVNNGNGGTFNLTPGATYSGGANFTANSTVNGQGATIQLTNAQLINVGGGRLTMNNVIIERIGGGSDAGSFGLRIVAPGSVALTSVTIRGFQNGFHSLGAHSTQSTITNSTFSTISGSCLLLGGGNNVRLQSSTINTGVNGFGVFLEAGGSPVIRGNTFDAPADGQTRTGILALQNCWDAGPENSVAFNAFNNHSTGVTLSAQAGQVQAPHIFANTFAHFSANSGAVHIRAQNAEALVESNSFSGGATALEVTGAGSYMEGGFAAASRPFRNNTMFDMLGGTVVNLNDRSPDVLNNYFQTTNTAIYVKREARSILIQGNSMFSLGIDEGNINAPPPIGTAISLDESSNGRVLDNYVDGYLGGIQVINGSNGVVSRNVVTRCFNGGILAESGSTAVMSDNVGFHNRADNFFVRASTVSFFRNESIDAGIYAGNLAGATGFAFDAAATIPFFVGNLSYRSLDAEVGIVSNSVIQFARSNTTIGSDLAGFFIQGGSSARSISGGYHDSGADLFANTFAGSSEYQLYACAFNRSRNFSMNVSSGTTQGRVWHNMINNMTQGMVAGSAAGTNLPFERNIMGPSVSPPPSAALVIANGGRFETRNNRFSALSGVGHSGAGAASESNFDWWGSPAGPNAAPPALQVNNIIVPTFLTAPDCQMRVDGPANLAIGQTYAGSFPEAGVAYSITPGRAVSDGFLYFGQFDGLATGISAPAGLLPRAVYAVVLPYQAWRASSGSISFDFVPGEVPGPFGSADVALTRYNSLTQTWVGAPSRVSGSSVVFEWGGEETIDPCGLFALVARTPTDALSAWRGERHMVGALPLRTEEATALAARNGNGVADVGDLISLVNANRNN
jgi:hypothetical protein